MNLISFTTGKLRNEMKFYSDWCLELSAEWNGNPKGTKVEWNDTETGEIVLRRVPEEN